MHEPCGIVHRVEWKTGVTDLLFHI